MSAALSGDPARMEDAIKRAEQVGVQSFKMLLIKGWHACSTGKPADGLRYLTAARDLKPDSVAVISLLAQAQSTQQQWSEYELGFMRAQNLEPSTPEDYLFKGYMMISDDPDGGLALINEAIRLRPSSMALLLRAEAKATRAQFSLSTNDADGAVRDLEAVRSVLPEGQGVAYTSAFVYATASMLHARAGATNQAIQFSAAADRAVAGLGALSDTPEGLTQRVLVLEMTGREEEQFRLLEDLVERRQQRHPLVVTRYAIGLCVRGRFVRALEILDPVAPNDSFLDGVRMAALLAVPERRGEFDHAFQNYLKRYPAPGDQLYGLWQPWFAGRTNLALSLGRRFHEKPLVGFERRRPEMHRMSRYLAGILNDEEFMKLSRETFGGYWDSHFAIGARKLGEGDREAGIKHLRKAVVAPCFWMYSYEFARIMLAIVEREPNWPPPLPAQP